MFNTKTKILLSLSSLLPLTACGSSTHSTPQPYRPLNLSGKSESFKQGAHDGCLTATEKYKKNHDAFNDDFDYNEGWWAGRRNCEGREYADY